MGWAFGNSSHGEPSKQQLLLPFIITFNHTLYTFAITSDTQLHVRHVCSWSRPGHWLRLMITSGQHHNVWNFSSNQTGLILIIFSKPSIRRFSFSCYAGSADLSQVPQQVCRIPHSPACDKQYFLVTESCNCLGPENKCVVTANMLVGGGGKIGNSLLRRSFSTSKFKLIIHR